MSLKAGTRVRTYKPVVYKPTDNAIVISDKNNDRKFMFLSEETKPDYRPIESRRKGENKPCPRIDHRPLGADAYNSKVYLSILLENKEAALNYLFCSPSLTLALNRLESHKSFSLGRPRKINTLYSLAAADIHLIYNT